MIAVTTLTKLVPLSIQLTLALFQVDQFPLLKIKLVDFGLSHCTSRGQTPELQMKTFCGTYEFLAPEQGGGKRSIRLSLKSSAP